MIQFLVTFIFFLATFFLTKGQCSQVNDFKAKNTCLADAVEFVATSSSDTLDWHWDFGDPSSGSMNNYIGKNATHVYNVVGTYEITLTISGNCAGIVKKTIVISNKPNHVDLRDTIFCEGVENMYTSKTILNNDNLLWSTGEKSSSIKIVNQGNYWLKSFNGTCYVTDTALVKMWGQDNEGDKYQFFGNGENIGTASLANALSTSYSSSIISSPTGELLCYTDGKTVFNKLHQVMENGTQLMGANNALQSTIILPDPRANNIYYTFNINDQYELNYSIIDLSYNLGLGKVTDKNIVLTSACNKIASYYEGNTFYVIAQPKFSSLIYTYIIDKNGLNITPIVSTVSYHNALNGNITFSNDGNKVIISNYEDKSICIYNFNKSKGTLNNEFCFNTIGNPIGLALATNNKYLYVTEANENQIVKYNIAVFNQQIIDTTYWVVSYNKNYNYGSLKLMPNGQIVVAKSASNALDIIKSPNLDSLKINYTENSILLKNSSNNLSLPNLPFNYFYKKAWGISAAKLCLGDETNFSITTPDIIKKSYWSLGISSFIDKDTAKQFKFKYPAVGSYPISCKIIHMCGDTTLYKSIQINEYPLVDLGKDTLICGDSFVLDSKNPQYVNLWNNGKKTSTVYIINDSLYSVSVNNKGCISKDTINIAFAHFKKGIIGNDTTLCEGQDLNLYLNNRVKSTSILWNNQFNVDTFHVVLQGQYFVDVNFKTCDFKDTINVDYVLTPVYSLPKLDSICQEVQKKYDLSHLIHYNINWSTGDSGHILETKLGGTIKFEINKKQCTFYDSIKIVRLPLPQLSLESKYSFCPYEVPNITIDIKSENSSCIWSPNVGNASIVTLQDPGVYTVEATNKFGCTVKKSTELLHTCTPYIYIPNAFSPNGDNINDLFNIHSKNINSFELIIFNKWGEIIFVSNQIDKFWDGTYRNQVVSEDVYTYKVTYSTIVENSNKQFVEFGNITLIK